MGGCAGEVGAWPIAGATDPRVNPPANAAPPLRNSLRSRRFEAIGLSFADELARKSLRRLESIRSSPDATEHKKAMLVSRTLATGPRIAGWLRQIGGPGGAVFSASDTLQ